MNRASVEVRRGPMESIATDVGLHEVPILRAIYGDSNITVDGTHSDESAADVGTEYARLARRYGEHPKAGVPWVEYVYGLPATGKLADALAAKPKRAA